MENLLFTQNDNNVGQNDYIDIVQAVARIKRLIENAIVENGVDGKNNLIRTQIPICLLHDAAKAEFIRQGVNPNKIKPLYGTHLDEQKVAGFFKFKDQDVCILPNNLRPQQEKLTFDGILYGKTDPLGKEYTEHILSVNVRSQLSSIAKNFDTLYERTFAEALNLHLRCPQMVLGEFYMIPVYEYDDAAAKEHRVAFKRNTKIKEHIIKYISSFNAVNDRRTTEGQEYKYERVCLLIVDFRYDTPKIYDNTEDLINDGLLPRGTQMSINNLNFPTFISTLLNIYESRFGSGRFT
mgnify:CR=1 FL=1